MLPDFPKIKKIRFAFLMNKAREVAVANEPIFGKIAGRSIPEGDDWSSRSIDGRMDGGFNKFESEYSIEPDELPKLYDKQWIEKLVEYLFKPMIDHEARMFFKKMDEVTASTGNVLKSEGGNLEDDILNAIRMIAIDFDSLGNPIMPTMLVGEKAFERLKSLQTSPEFDKKWSELIETKRIEWRLEQANRKLVN